MSGEVGFENHRPVQYGAGVDFSFVPVRDLDVLGCCKVNPSAFSKAFGNLGSVYMYCRETRVHDHSLHARLFVPEFGITEDPATGSAVAALAGVTMLYDQPTAGTHRLVIEQGHFMNRPRHINLELDVNNGLHAARIGGEAVIVANGELLV